MVKKGTPKSAPMNACAGMRLPLIIGTAILLLLLFILIAVAVTMQTNSKRKSNNCATKSCTVYLFHSPTCPHCVKAMPEFEAFEEWATPKYPNMSVERVSVPDATPAQQNMIRCLNVTKVPTVVFVRRNGSLHYLDGPCTKENLKKHAEKAWA